MKHSRAIYLTRLPLVTLKSGMTLDGKIAGPQGGSVNAPLAADRWITSEESRAHAQSLRHESDAILVGAGTIVADDPLLTDRTGLPRRRPLLRVVLDSRLRCPLESQLVKTAQNDVLIFCSFAEEKKRRALEDRGVRVEQIPLDSNSHPDPMTAAPISTRPWYVWENWESPACSLKAEHWSTGRRWPRT